MKKAGWTREFWAKAAAFALTTLLVPFACVCGASLAATYAFEWWSNQWTVKYDMFLVWARHEDLYWAQRGMDFLYNLHFAATPLLVVCVVLIVFFIVYFARVSGRRPGSDEVHANWQEKIPFDLYLLVVGFCVVGLFYIADETMQAWRMEPFAYTLLLLAIVAVTEALLLAAWMTLCTRVKLSGWWRNTVIFWVLRLCWRLAKWCWRVLCAIGRGVRDFFRGVPLIWRTVLCGGAFWVTAFLLAWERAWGMLFSALAASFLLACAVSLQLRKLQAGGAALAAGDLDAKVDTSHLFWDFRRHGENLNDISRGMQAAVDKQLKSEHLKTELITNVSHDIKTPLTSIINYVGLLRRDPGEEQAKEYLEVLDRQSKRLKKLTEDLVEMSKASTGNLPVNASRRSLNELLLQALGEYSERLDKAQLEAVLTLPDRETFAWVDGALLWRVLDNIFSNACKYALAGTRFYIDSAECEGRVKLSFKNISRDRLNVPADELMERFVRGDSARGGEGSGLGLNIAKTLTELQGGTMELFIDGDLFRVDITFPAIQ